MATQPNMTRWAWALIGFFAGGVAGFGLGAWGFLLTPAWAKVDPAMNDLCIPVLFAMTFTLAGMLCGMALGWLAAELFGRRRPRST
jgi:hypothetical protein